MIEVGPDDRRLDPFRQLTSRRTTDVVVEGEIAVTRYLASGWPVRTVVATAAHAGRIAPQCGSQTALLVASHAVLRTVTGFDFHRGCLAVGPRPPTATDPAALVAAAVAQLPEATSTTVVCVGLADPANLGAIIRSARALGTDLIVHDGAADPLGRRAIRASAGHVFSIPVVQCDDPATTVAALRDHYGSDGEVLAAVADARATSARLHHRRRHVALLLGSEGEGLPPSMIEAADQPLTVTMASGVDSLSVTAAAAVMLWALAGADPRREP